MAFEDVVNVPVTEVDTTIDVVSMGPGDQERDQVKVTSALTLGGDIDPGKEALLILPLASIAQGKPVVRFTEDAVQDAHEFEIADLERSVYDQELVERLEAIEDGASKKELKAIAVQIERCADSLSAAAIRVKPGQRKLRLFYEIEAARVADKQFEFSVIGPLPSFLLPPGGSIGLVALLPRRTSMVSAVALQDPNNPGSEIHPRQETDMGFRHLVGWQWQFDPLFRIRYSY